MRGLVTKRTRQTHKSNLYFSPHVPRRRAKITYNISYSQIASFSYVSFRVYFSVRFSLTVYSVSSIEWQFIWEKASSNGDLGFTLYNENDKEFFNRPLSSAGSNNVIVSEIISRIVVTSGTNGYHGNFEVRDTNGNTMKFECENCESESTSFILGSLNLDSNDIGGLRPDHTICLGTCTFILTGRTL